MKHTSKFSDQLRLAVLNCGETRYRISKATGIPESNLSRFVRGDAWLSMESLDKLIDYLGLKLVAPKTTKPKGNK